MNFQQVSDHFRRSTEPLAVSKIVIVSDRGDYTGDGKMWREGHHIELDVTLHGDGELPMIGGAYTREEFWKIGGVIEGQVPFWGVSLPGQHGLQTARFTVRSGRFDFDRIHHLVLPFEDGNLRDAMLEAVKTGEPPDGLVTGDYAFARITDYKLVWADEFTVTVSENPFLGKTTNQRRDTLCGEFDTFEYGLIKREADTEIHVRVKNDAIGPHLALTRMMQAMYRALAFLHGRHCWPQWERFNDGTNVVAEHTTAPRTVSVNNYTLLTSTAASNGAKPTELIGKLLQCFLREDDFAESFDNYLFLAREAAGSDTPAHIRALGLCTVFEGFVGFLHDHVCVAPDNAGDVEFEKARSALVHFAKDQMAQTAGSSPQGVAWNRCIGLLSSARPLRPADKYQQLVQTFGLPADSMQAALEAWKKHRHPARPWCHTGEQPDGSNVRYQSNRRSNQHPGGSGRGVLWSGGVISNRRSIHSDSLPEFRFVLMRRDSIPDGIFGDLRSRSRMKSILAGPRVHVGRAECIRRIELSTTRSMKLPSVETPPERA